MRESVDLNTDFKSFSCSKQRNWPESAIVPPTKRKAGSGDWREIAFMGSADLPKSSARSYAVAFVFQACVIDQFISCFNTSLSL